MKPLRFALVGENVGYSLSPQIFAAMFAQLGREGRFDVYSLARDHLGEGVARLVDQDYSGLAVTIPHKMDIIHCLSSIDETARKVGAVNSIAIQNRVLTGYNTDCDGFTFALRRQGFAGCERVLILGGGGGARAALVALQRDFGLARFVVCARDPVRLAAFERHFRSWYPDLEIQLIKDTNLTRGGNPGCDLVVNCTPLGGPNLIRKKALPPEFDWSSVQRYVDLNYNRDNGMMLRARQQGVEVSDGSAMLVAQAIRSLELWVGLKVAFEPVYREVFPDAEG